MVDVEGLITDDKSRHGRDASRLRFGNPILLLSEVDDLDFELAAIESVDDGVLSTYTDGASSMIE